MKGSVEIILELTIDAGPLCKAGLHAVCAPLLDGTLEVELGVLGVYADRG